MVSTQKHKHYYTLNRAKCQAAYNFKRSQIISGLRRVSKTVYGSPDVTTKYCYDGGQVIAEYDGSDNLLRKFIYGPGINEPDGWWEYQWHRVSPWSLYYKQLEDRLGTAAVENVTAPEQRAGSIWPHLAKWAGNQAL